MSPKAKQIVPKKAQSALVRIAHWLLREFDDSPAYPLPKNLGPLIEAANVHIRDIELRDKGQAPDWKLHQLLGRMVQQFPKVRKRWITLAMSIAFCFGDNP